MKQLTILVDVDNVLEDLNEAWVKAINEKYGTDVDPNDITQWDITKFFPSLSRTQVFSPLHTKELWDSLEPLHGAQEYLKKLAKDGHRVIIVTSSHPDTVLHKSRFLSRYFPFIPFKDIIIASHKQLVCGDVLIDDAPHNLDGGHYLGVLMTAPHNQNYDAESNGFIRADNWSSIYNIICNLAERSE